MPEIQRILEQNKCDHIQLLGFKQGDELQNLIQNSICMVLPSELYENCPMSILEAYAYGKPAIGADIGGIPELIEDGVDGFLVPPSQPEALREQLQWMFEHKGEAVEMGRAGRRKVETEFNPEIHYEKIMKIYQQFL